MKRYGLVCAFALLLTLGSFGISAESLDSIYDLNNSWRTPLSETGNRVSVRVDADRGIHRLASVGVAVGCLGEDGNVVGATPDEVMIADDAMSCSLMPNGFLCDSPIDQEAMSLDISFTYELDMCEYGDTVFSITENSLCPADQIACRERITVTEEIGVVASPTSVNLNEFGVADDTFSLGVIASLVTIIGLGVITTRNLSRAED